MTRCNFTVTFEASRPATELIRWSPVHGYIDIGPLSASRIEIKLGTHSITTGDWMVPLATELGKAVLSEEVVSVVRFMDNPEVIRITRSGEDTVVEYGWEKSGGEPPEIEARAVVSQSCVVKTVSMLIENVGRWLLDANPELIADPNVADMLVVARELATRARD